MQGNAICKCIDYLIANEIYARPQEAINKKTRVDK